MERNGARLFVLSAFLLPFLSFGMEKKIIDPKIGVHNFLQALEKGHDRAACNLLEALSLHKKKTRNDEAIFYLLHHERKRFARLIYQLHNKIALEAYIRILESIDCEHAISISDWCKEIGFSEYDADCCFPETTKYNLFSPSWYTLHRLRLETYLEARQYSAGIESIVIDDRLKTIAYKVGMLSAQKHDAGLAVPFLFPAAQLHDEYARACLADICLQNPCFIAPGMSWLQSMADHYFTEMPKAHDMVIRLYILAASASAEDREKAFRLFSSLLNNPEEALYAAQNWSDPMIKHMKALALKHDRAAVKLLALRALICNLDVADVYGYLAAADHDDPWLLYLYAAIAEKHTLKADELCALLLTYFNLLVCKEEYIEEQSYRALKRYATENNELAVRLLALRENGNENISDYVKLLGSLQDCKNKNCFLESFLTSVINNVPAYLFRNSCFTAQKLFMDAQLAAHDHGFGGVQSLVDFCRACGFVYDNARDDLRACPFLQTAALLHDRGSQKRLAQLCAGNPRLIVPAMQELRPILVKSAGSKAYAGIVNLYLLMSGDETRRAEAFSVLCKLAETKPTLILYAFNHQSRELEQLVASLLAVGDKSMILIQALFELYGAPARDNTLALLGTIADEGNHWITYIRAALAEKNNMMHGVIDDYVHLLYNGNKFLATKALEALKRASQRGDVQACARLFCYVCRTMTDKQSAETILSHHDMNKLLVYLQEHCIDELQMGCKTNAVATYVLARCYEQKSESSENEYERFAYLRRAIELYNDADSQQYPCRMRVTPAMFISLAHYYLKQGATRDAQWCENLMIQWCTPADCLKSLDQLCTHAVHREYDMLYTCLAKTDGNVAYQVAMRYINGFQTSSFWQPDVIKAKEYLHYAALQNHPEGACRYAKMVLQDSDIPKKERQEAVAWLQRFGQKEDQDVQRFLLDAQQELEQSRRDTSIGILENKLAEKIKLDDAFKFLINLAQNGDDKALLFMGNWLSLKHRYNNRTFSVNIPLAIQFLDAYNKKYPHDKVVALKLITLWLDQMENDVACDLQRVRAVADELWSNKITVTSNDGEDILRKKILYYLGDYDELLQELKIGGIEPQAAWIISLCLLHKQNRTKEMDAVLCQELSTALAFGDSKMILARQSLIDARFALEALCACKCNEAPIFVARIAFLLGSNHCAVKAQQLDNKKLVQELMSLADKNVLAANFLLFLKRNKCWGMKINSDDVVLCDKILKLKCSSVSVETERFNQIQSCIILEKLMDFSNQSENELLAMLKLFYRFAFCKLASSTLSNKIDGMESFIMAENNIVDKPPLFQNVLMKENLYHELKDLALQQHNWYALIALSYSVAMRCAVHKFPWGEEIEKIMNCFIATCSRDCKELSESDESTKSCFSKTCNKWAACLCQIMPAVEVSPRLFYEKVLEVDPSNTEALFGMAGILIADKKSASDAKLGLRYLRCAAQKAQGFAAAAYLGRLLMKIDDYSNPWIEKNVKEGIAWLKRAAEFGDHDSYILYRAAVIDDEEPIITEPKLPVDEVKIRLCLNKAEALVINGQFQNAKEIYDALIKNYLHSDSALLLVSMYIRETQDVAYIGRYLLQWLACKCYWGERDIVNNQQFKKLYKYLSDAANNDRQAYLWAARVKSVILTIIGKNAN